MVVGINRVKLQMHIVVVIVKFMFKGQWKAVGSFILEWEKEGYNKVF